MSMVQTRRGFVTTLSLAGAAGLVLPPPSLGDRGRDAHCWTPPAQIRTCGFPAYGSYLGWLTAKRTLGVGDLPYAVQRLGHTHPALRPECALLVRIPLGSRPWLRRLRRGLRRLVHRVHSYYSGM